MFYKKENRSKALFSHLTAETLCVHKIDRCKHHRYIDKPVFLFHDAPILPIVCCQFPFVGRQGLRQEIQSVRQDNGIFYIHEITLGLLYRKHLHNFWNRLNIWIYIVFPKDLYGFFSPLMSANNTPASSSPA